MGQAFYTPDVDDSFRYWVEREALVALKADAVTWTALPVEASFRRFFRVSTGSGSLVAMQAPTDREDTTQFVHIGELFKRHEIGVPVIHAADTQRGFALMEDLGEDTLERAYARGDSERSLTLALGTIARIQGVQDAQGVIPDYTSERLRMELGIFSEWFLGGLLGIDAPPWYRQMAEHLVNSALEQPKCPMHRDFHCRNLLITPTGTLGVVDFQDALHGPVTYDLASLLGDCYHEFEGTEIDAALQSYHRAAQQLDIPGIPDWHQFRRCFDLMVMQRQLKAVGIFARLWLRDGRRSHIVSIAPVLVRLAALSRNYAATSQLARSIQDNWLSAAIAKTARVIE